VARSRSPAGKQPGGPEIGLKPEGSVTLELEVGEALPLARRLAAEAGMRGINRQDDAVGPVLAIGIASIGLDR
jgi:hypothetical protein